MSVMAGILTGVLVWSVVFTIAGFQIRDPSVVALATGVSSVCTAALTAIIL